MQFIAKFYRFILARISAAISILTRRSHKSEAQPAQPHRRFTIVKAVLVGIVVLLLVGYGNFFYATQFWTGFDPDYPTKIIPAATSQQATAVPAGNPLPQQSGTAKPPQSCKRSEIAAVSAYLIDFNVNQNSWISSMLLSKLGFFGIAWRDTPIFDNKAAFQLGINQVLRRTTTELVDTLGRTRGTSQIDQNLQDARTALSWSETAWYIGARGPTRTTQGMYREAMARLNAFNADLEKCHATFDARADNLLTFLDRIAGDIGSTTDVLRVQIENGRSMYLDFRADDRFWFAYGQLYAYYGILEATQADFATIIRDRNLTTVWEKMQSQMRTALNMQPLIIFNGNESSIFVPSHLSSMGFNLLRARSQIIEIRSILDR